VKALLALESTSVPAPDFTSGAAEVSGVFKVSTPEALVT